jgi:hypothetical protein
VGVERQGKERARETQGKQETRGAQKTPGTQGTPRKQGARGAQRTQITKGTREAQRAPGVSGSRTVWRSPQATTTILNVGELQAEGLGVQAERSPLLRPLDDGNRPNGVGAKRVVAFQVHDAEADESGSLPTGYNPTVA